MPAPVARMSWSSAPGRAIDVDGGVGGKARARYGGVCISRPELGRRPVLERLREREPGQGFRRRRSSRRPPPARAREARSHSFFARGLGARVVQAFIDRPGPGGRRALARAVDQPFPDSISRWGSTSPAARLLGRDFRERRPAVSREPRSRILVAHLSRPRERPIGHRLAITLLRLSGIDEVGRGVVAGPARTSSPIEYEAVGGALVVGPLLADLDVDERAAVAQRLDGVDLAGE